jgi:stalled ribosome rescue protein Dom34
MAMKHVVVWIDHQSAHVLHFNADESESKKVVAHSMHGHAHGKKKARDSKHAGAGTQFFADVIANISGSDEILIVGPGEAKAEFASYFTSHAPDVAQRILGIETVDHPTDPQILAYARKYFRAKDRMLGDAALP